MSSDGPDARPQADRTDHDISPTSSQPKPSPAMTAVALGAAALAMILSAASLCNFERGEIGRIKTALARQPKDLLSERDINRRFRTPPWLDVANTKARSGQSGTGIAQDGIPAIDDPAFVSVSDHRLKDLGVEQDTEVIGYEYNGDARAYPLHILSRHELANDVVGGKPVAVAY